MRDTAPNLYDSNDTTIARVLKELGMDLPCRAVSDREIREILFGRAMSVVELMTLRGSVTPMKDRRTKRTNRKSWKKDEWLL